MIDPRYGGETFEDAAWRLHYAYKAAYERAERLQKDYDEVKERWVNRMTPIVTVTQDEELSNPGTSIVTVELTPYVVEIRLASVLLKSALPHILEDVQRRIGQQIVDQWLFDE